MKRFFTLLACAAALFLTSCNSKVLITAADSHSAVVAFKINFSKSFIDVGKSVTGKDELPVNGKNITQIMMAAGFDNIISNSTNYSISASGIYDCTTSIAQKTQILTVTPDSMELKLGPEQFKNIYSMMNEEEQSYFDLLMIPSLCDEESTAEEYEVTVASLYGPTFAGDLSKGVISFTLKRQAAEKQYSITLGELFTLRESKTWKLEF